MPRKKAGLPRRKGLAKTLRQTMREQATILDLSGRKLTELPREISQLAGLQELNLRGNRLTALPDWLGELAHLQWLCLDYNPLATVPAVVGRLVNLRRLDLNAASVFWVRRMAALSGEQSAIEDWQIKRDGNKRGLVKVLA